MNEFADEAATLGGIAVCAECAVEMGITPENAVLAAVITGALLRAGAHWLYIWWQARKVAAATPADQAGQEKN